MVLFRYGPRSRRLECTCGMRGREIEIRHRYEVHRPRALSDLQVSDVMLHAVATRCSRLRQLVIRYCPQVTDAGLVAVPAARDDGFPRARDEAHLERWEIRLGAQVAAANPELAVLDVAGCGVTGACHWPVTASRPWPVGRGSVGVRSVLTGPGPCCGGGSGRAMALIDAAIGMGCAGSSTTTAMTA